ncbi:MAG: galactokinase [Oscillospiraceae bacterium]|nr:galactokinase [Oscillospiraceae bacterium]
MNINTVLYKLENDEFSDVFRQLYGDMKSDLDYQKKRYINLVNSFVKFYPHREDVKIFSAPGRTEIGGNHTDHQHGCVLAAAVNIDAAAAVAFHNDNVIRIKSEGYDFFTVSLDDLGVHENEKGTAAIVRGIVSRFYEIGVEIGGFDAYCTSDVLSGSGISSSAAFETLIGTIIDSHYNNGRAGAVEIAKIGQYAENVYFGKNSGLMDQMVSSVGGLVEIDFADTENPRINSFSFDFEQAGYSLCITDTKGSHENLTDDYVAVRSEMEAVAKYFDKRFLRQVNEEEFYAELPKIRKSCSDRAILRAVHFFDENRRAVAEAEALKKDNIDYFLGLVRQSGDSSSQLLQNLYSVTQPTQQEIPLAITMSKKILGNKGAVRVHGGGFAGTIQAFVPVDMVEVYKNEIDRIFGKGSCLKLRIRPMGGAEITKEMTI